MCCLISEGSKDIASESIENRRCRSPRCRLTPLSMNPREYPHKSSSVYCQKLKSLRYIFASDSMGPSSFKFSWWAPKITYFWNRVRNGSLRSSKVLKFGTNQKRVCDFLLVIDSNLGHILHRFWDTATCWPKIPLFSTPLSFKAVARGEPFWISGWTFYRQGQSLWTIRRWRFHDPSLRRFHTVPACDRWTDRQTDISTMANTGLCVASCADVL